MQHQDYKTIYLTQKKPQVHIQKEEKRNNYLKNDEIPKQVTYNHPLLRELKTEIQKARLKSSKTQVGLANELNLPKDTINKIESGVAIYDPALLSKLENKLNTKFTRPNKSTLKSNFEIADY